MLAVCKLTTMISVAILSVSFSIRSATFRSFHVDSRAGDDARTGLSEEEAWRSLARVGDTHLLPGDSVLFRRGSRFSGMLTVNDSGNLDQPIVISSYGSPNDPAPAFTNPVFDPDDGEFGNCIRLNGSFIRVENLYFHHTVAELSGKISFETMWELGAVHIGKTARDCVVQKNEFVDCGVGIRSYGERALIRANHIHDCNRILKEWNWGPIGIWLGGDHQTVSRNTIVNYSVVDPRINWGPNGYGSGADGSAIEIDDARVPKSDISIHHNYTRANQGFLEVTWSDVAHNPSYLNFSIHHNISDDYQQFIALWRGAGCRIEHNTVIRRRVNANEWGVFNITQHDSRNMVRNNVVVTENDVVIFNTGRTGNAQPNTIIAHNLYFAASGELLMGLEGPGDNPVFGDPLFVDYDNPGTTPLAFTPRMLSPAIGRGLDLDYTTDHFEQTISRESPDLGAIEHRSNHE